MPSIKHPFDPDSLYALTDDGYIQVSNGNSVGLFTDQGVYVSGEIKQADPQLCVWIGNNPEPGTQQNKVGRSSIMAKRK